MPTPSDNTPHLETNAVEEVSAYHLSCPPDTDRIPTWRASSEESIVDNADDDAVPASVTTWPPSTISSTVMREADNSPDSMLGIETSPQSTGGKLAQQDDDLNMESSSPVSVSSTVSKEERAMSALPPISTAPSTPSNLDYEFSNIRVSMFRSCHFGNSN